MGQHGAHRLPPQNIEAEMSVLGAVLLENSAISKVEEYLKPKDFYRVEHRNIFEVMLKLSEEGQGIDLVTVTSELNRVKKLEQCGGSSYLSKLVDYVPTAANVGYYARMVQDASVLRNVLKVATEVESKAYENGDPKEALELAQSEFMAMGAEGRKENSASVKELMAPVFTSLKTLYERKELVTGVPTGFNDLDLMTAGMQPGDLIIVAGRPSMGKTSFVMNLVENACVGIGKDKAALVFSLEMGKEQLVQRLVASVARVDASKLRTGQFQQADWPKLTSAAGTLTEAKIYIDDTPGINIAELRAKARRHKMEHDIGLIVVDYLQLATADRNDSRQGEISEISRLLKQIAKELHVPVVALSQLNRSLESRNDKRPMMADLRESGAIEQDADVIMFVYREAVYCEKCKDKDQECDIGHAKDAEIIIGKQRNGPIGTVKLMFEGRYTRFENRSSRDS